HRVKLIPGQPAVGALPDFADQIGVRIFGFNAAPKFAPEVIVVNLSWYVEPPSIDTLLNPVFRHAEQKGAHLGISVIELRQRFEIPPRLVARWSQIIIRVQGKLL